MNILWRASKHAAGWLLVSMLIGNINWQLVWEQQYFQNVPDNFSSCCASNGLKNGRAVICNVFRFRVQTSIAYLRQKHWLVVNHKRLRFAWRVPGLGHCVSFKRILLSCGWAFPRKQFLHHNKLWFKRFHFLFVSGFAVNPSPTIHSTSTSHCPDIPDELYKEKMRMRSFNEDISAY